MPGSTPFHVPPNVLHGCDSSLVGRQHRSHRESRHRPRLSPTTSYRGRGTRGRRGTRTVRPGIQGQGPTAGDRQGARPEGQRPDEEVRHHRPDPGDDRVTARGANGDRRPRRAPRSTGPAANGDAPPAVAARRRRRPAPDVVDAGPARRRSTAPAAVLDAEEPPAEWELAVGGRRRRTSTMTPRRAANDGLVSTPAGDADTPRQRGGPTRANGRSAERSGGGGQPQGRSASRQPGAGQQVDDGESRNRRRRRRRKGGGRGLDGPQGDDVAARRASARRAGASPASRSRCRATSTCATRATASCA